MDTEKLVEDVVLPDTPAGRLIGIASSLLAVVVPVLAVLWIMSVPQRLGMLVYPEQVVGLMLGASLAVVYLRKAVDKNPLIAAFNIALAVASIILAFYVYVRFPVLSEATHLHQTEALLLGIAVTLLTMEALRRVVGWTLIIIFGVLFFYAIFGDWVPGALKGRPMATADVLRFLGTDSSAIWGQTLQIAAFVVVVFVLFGGLLLAVGGGEFFTQLAMRVAGRGPGNAAKVAVTASALFGTISGSAVSNVMTTGIMTIPLMKKGGFTPAQAGGIEAVSSTGAQLAPPVLGAAAFLMAEFLQVPYKEIALAAILPSALYYLSIFVQIDFTSRRDKIPSLGIIERTPLLKVLLNGWLSILSFIVLIACMFTWNMRAEIAAVWSIGILVAAAFIAGMLKIGDKYLSARDVIKSIVDTGRQTCDVLLVTAVSGMIIGLLSTTGLDFALSMYLLEFGGHSMFGLLIVTALIGIVLGLGLPTTGVYLLLAALAAPTLVQLGIEPMAAHMFVLYYGILSMITPPIALASFAAASIAGATQSQTDKEAFKFGWIAYLLPFLFIYKPGLLLIGSWTEIAYVSVSSVVALFLVTGGLVGHTTRRLSVVMRLLWTVTGFLVIAPTEEIGGAALEYGLCLFGAFILLVHWFVVPMIAEKRPASEPV